MKSDKFKIIVKPAWADRASKNIWYSQHGNKPFTVQQSEKFANFWKVCEGPLEGNVIEKEACVLL